MGFNYNLKVLDEWHKAHPKTAERRIGDGQHGFDARHLLDRQAAQLGQRLRPEPYRLVGTRRRVVEVLRRARMALGRLCLDGLRLSRRAHALRMAVDQFAVRHRRHVRLSQGQLLLLQSVVGIGAGAASVSRTGIGISARASRSQCGCIRISIRWKLFLNGKSQGSQKVQPLTHLEWKVKYEPGVLEARGTKDGKVVLTEKRETTGEPDTIRLTADRTEINADGEDVAVLTRGGARQGRPGDPYGG